MKIGRELLKLCSKSCPTKNRRSAWKGFFYGVL